MCPGGRYDTAVDRPDIYSEQHGDENKPTLVLVHGAPDRSTGFRDLLTYLADWCVILYDRRGYGRSANVPQARAMIDHASDLIAIVESFEVPPVVIAHSFGSNIAMLAATLRPRAFAAMGLWEPSLPWVDWWSETTKAYNAAVANSKEPATDIEAMYRALLGDDTWDGLSADVKARRRAEAVAFQIDMASELNAPFDFADVQVPALVGYGTATSPEHREGARWLVEQLPKARLYACPGAGHFAPRTHPKEFAAFVDAVTPIG
jgi:pimeloyl-ACP methyl ester carboxylesterase